MRPKTLFALVAVLALFATSCASSKDTGFPAVEPTTTEHATESAQPTPTSTAAVPLEGPIDVGDNFYKPVAATVKVGTKVTWTQSGVAPHTVTADDESFDSHPQCLQNPSECMQDGDTYTYTFNKAGEFPYFCRLHGTKGGVGMAGKIIVEA